MDPELPEPVQVPAGLANAFEQMMYGPGGKPPLPPVPPVPPVPFSRLAHVARGIGYMTGIVICLGIVFGIVVACLAMWEAVH